jgi:hypothetical protein
MLINTRKSELALYMQIIRTHTYTQAGRKCSDKEEAQSLSSGGQIVAFLKAAANELSTPSKKQKPCTTNDMHKSDSSTSKQAAQHKKQKPGANYVHNHDDHEQKRAGHVETARNSRQAATAVGADTMTSSSSSCTDSAHANSHQGQQQQQTRVDAHTSRKRQTAKSGSESLSTVTNQAGSVHTTHGEGADTGSKDVDMLIVAALAANNNGGARARAGKISGKRAKKIVDDMREEDEDMDVRVISRDCQVILSILYVFASVCL